MANKYANLTSRQLLLISAVALGLFGLFSIIFLSFASAYFYNQGYQNGLQNVKNLPTLGDLSDLSATPEASVTPVIANDYWTELDLDNHATHQPNQRMEFKFSDAIKKSVHLQANSAGCYKYSFDFTKIELLTGPCGLGGINNEHVESINYSSANGKVTFDGAIEKDAGTPADSNTYWLIMSYAVDGNPAATLLTTDHGKVEVPQLKQEAAKIVTNIVSAN